MILHELVNSFFALKSGHSNRCKLPGHGFHWIDEVREGEWYLHGRLIAKYEPPRLWISNAGLYTKSVERRLSRIVTRWESLHTRRVDITLTVYPDVAVLWKREWDDEIRWWGESEGYVIDNGLTIIPTNSGGMAVLHPVRRVLKKHRKNTKVKSFIIPRFGNIFIKGDAAFVNYGPLLIEVTLDELKEMLRKALGDKSRVVQLISKVDSVGELKVFLALTR